MRNFQQPPERDTFRDTPPALLPFAHSLHETEHYYKEYETTNRRVGVFAEAARIALTRPYFASQVRDLFDMRPDIDNQYAWMLLLRSYQADLLQRDDTYPERYDQADVWLEAFEDIEDDDSRSEIISLNLITKQVQSNIAERYKSVKLLSALLQDRVGDRPSHLDVGSSLMHGSIKLAYSHVESDDRTGFGPMELSHHTDSLEDFVPSKRLTKLANRAIRQQVEYGSLMGIDITSIDDNVIRKWAMSCSFKPDELLDDRRKREFDYLDSLDREHNRIVFYEDDFSELNHQKFREKSPVKEYDIITFSTVLYQVSPKERLAMVTNAANYLSKEGIIIIQDAPDGNFSKPFNYYTEVIDGTDDNPKKQIMLRWENGRCRKAIAGLGRISLNGKSYNLTEALEKWNASSIQPSAFEPDQNISS